MLITPSGPRSRLLAIASASSVPGGLDDTPLPTQVGDLPQPGVVEVRLLRAAPDVIGDVIESPSAAAVQIVAYLVTHGRRATTARLRDALAVYGRDRSIDAGTVSNSAGAARRALGARLVPLATNASGYTISEEVTCDWVRFLETSGIGRARELAENHDGAIEAWTAALELVEGVPGEESRRYLWVEIEGLQYEIERAVVEAAHRLALLAIAERSFELSAWAIKKGRILSPDSEELRRDAMRLALAEDDADAAKAEFADGIAVVDALRLGEEVDDETVALWSAAVKRGGLHDLGARNE